MTEEELNGILKDEAELLKKDLGLHSDLVIEIKANLTSTIKFVKMYDNDSFIYGIDSIVLTPPEPYSRNAIKLQAFFRGENRQKNEKVTINYNSDHRPVTIPYSMYFASATHFVSNDGEEKRQSQNISSIPAPSSSSTLAENNQAHDVEEKELAEMEYEPINSIFQHYLVIGFGDDSEDESEDEGMEEKTERRQRRRGLKTADNETDCQDFQPLSHDLVECSHDLDFFANIVKHILQPLSNNSANDYNHLLNNKGSFIECLKNMCAHIESDEEGDIKHQKIEIMRKIFNAIKSQSTGDQPNLPGAVLAKHRGIGEAFSFFTGPTSSITEFNNMHILFNEQNSDDAAYDEESDNNNNGI